MIFNNFRRTVAALLARLANRLDEDRHAARVDPQYAPVAPGDIFRRGDGCLLVVRQLLDNDEVGCELTRDLNGPYLALTAVRTPALWEMEKVWGTGDGADTKQ